MHTEAVCAVTWALTEAVCAVTWQCSEAVCTVTWVHLMLDSEIIFSHCAFRMFPAAVLPQSVLLPYGVIAHG